MPWLNYNLASKPVQDFEPQSRNNSLGQQKHHAVVVLWTWPQ